MTSNKTCVVDGNNNVYTAHIKLQIINGPSRESVRDALGLGLTVDYNLGLHHQIPFLNGPWLKAGIRGLRWIKPVNHQQSERDEAILIGEFGPITDGFHPEVYHGNYVARYDTTLRRGRLTIKFTWSEKLSRGE